MNYLEFLIIFTVLPIVLMTIFLRKVIDITFLKWLFVVSVIAFIATAGWDNYAVYSGIWHFPKNRTIGIKLFYVPLEEYMFFFLQTYTTGLLQLIFIKKNINYNINSSAIIFLPLIFIQDDGIWKLTFGSYNYLIHLFSWGGFFILVQFISGRKKILNNISLIILPSIIMTVYFSIADSISIGHGIWDFDPLQTTGIKLVNIPLEEILFFLVTNILITEAMVLFLPKRFLIRGTE